ncbi:M23 family metallopeptidase [Phenylobacterium sp. J367]|uniref:M23 family metallopeptidase n=1 Tax=Phenylobacterium sp. J367 TaxID=2898435 RepID=UPI002151765F|nr:M23 family metallopeptidase [Phenylobacterium sp. J367]MCR5877152.1 M23 family metallopeptidase [Phenylobacterium sp. J367]
MRIPVRAVETAKERLGQTVAVLAILGGTAALAMPAAHVGYTAAKKAEAQRIDLRDTIFPAAEATRIVWQGLDVDGDGQADFANPTGQEPRGHDAYGQGAFGARRDGGSRRHEGVDFVADAGQAVVAPISGYVTKIGYAYAGDADLKFVEITNPALRYAARVFYVEPAVEVGDAVAVGRPIGEVYSLQDKYPGGMTDHVHLEILDKGRRIAATEVLVAREQRVADVHMAD